MLSNQHLEWEKKGGKTGEAQPTPQDHLEIRVSGEEGWTITQKNPQAAKHWKYQK